MMPAVNISPTDSWVNRAYMMKGMEGGIMTPSPPAVATMAAKNTLSYPSSTRMGMHMAPTAAAVAGPEPEMAP